MNKESLMKLISKSLPAVCGAIIVILAQWSFGKFNNSLSMFVSAEKVVVNDETGIPTNTYLKLSVKLKKLPLSRIRINVDKDDCKVEVSRGEASGSESDKETLDKIGRILTESLLDDLNSSNQKNQCRKKGIILVPGDEVQYQAYCSAPSANPIHLKVTIRAQQMLFGIGLGHPTWTSSAVVLK